MKSRLHVDAVRESFTVLRWVRTAGALMVAFALSACGSAGVVGQMGSEYSDDYFGGGGEYCEECWGTGICAECDGVEDYCYRCHGTGVCSHCGGSGYEGDWSSKRGGSYAGSGSASSYGGESYGATYECPLCNGSGAQMCKSCRGSGMNDIYDDLSPVLKGFSSRYCEVCDGRGTATCTGCGGTGVI